MMCDREVCKGARKGSKSDTNCLYSIESNQYIYNTWNILEGEYSR